METTNRNAENPQRTDKTQIPDNNSVYTQQHKNTGLDINANKEANKDIKMENNSEQMNEYKSNEQIPSNDTTPENLTAPIDKDVNDNDSLHTEQKSQDNASDPGNPKGEDKGDDNDNSKSNSNIRNYLGSDKLNEKIASITKKYEEHKIRAESILSKYTMGIIYE